VDEAGAVQVLVVGKPARAAAVLRGAQISHPGRRQIRVHAGARRPPNGSKLVLFCTAGRCL
jgi:hypothetical protein